MMLAWSLTVVAFVLILVEVQGISSTISYNPHTIIGITIFTTFTLKSTTVSFYPTTIICTTITYTVHPVLLR
jgi:hypothetical protein